MKDYMPYKKKIDNKITNQIIIVQTSFTQFIDSLNSKSKITNSPNNKYNYSSLIQNRQKNTHKFQNLQILHKKFSQQKTKPQKFQKEDQPLKKNIHTKIKFQNKLQRTLNFNIDNQKRIESQHNLFKSKIYSIVQNKYEPVTLRYSTNRQKHNNNNKRLTYLDSTQKQKQYNSNNNIQIKLKFHDEDYLTSKKKYQPKNNVSRMSSINNPQSPKFNNIKQKISQELSSQMFLLQLLKIDHQKVIDILISQSNNIQQEKNGNKIFKFFKKIFQQLNIPKLSNPLVKKFNNCVYYGERSRVNYKHCGIIYYNNSSIYFGQFNNFRKHGQGIQIVQCKNIKNSCFVLYNTNIQSYVVLKGNFYKNTKSGNFLIQAENFIYQGQLVKGFLHGKGKLISQDQNFQGLWNMNQKVQGRQQFIKQGLFYEGQYKQRLFHGKGKLKSKNQLYEGDFKQGIKHGKGIIVTKEYIYQGFFRNGKKFGLGIMIDKNISDNFQQIIEKEDKKIFNVEFQDDYLVYKSQLVQNRLDQIETQSLVTINQKNENPTEMNSSSDKQFASPANILNQTNNKKLQMNKRIIQNPQVNKKTMMLQYLNFIPKQPEQQHLYYFNNKMVSYLQGNRRNLFLIRNHPLKN